MAQSPYQPSQTEKTPPALQTLLEVALRHGYNQVVSVLPPLPHDPRSQAKPPVTSECDPLTLDGLGKSLTYFFRDVVSRGWDRKKPVWLVRLLGDGELALPSHVHEVAVHPRLLGVSVPTEVVAYFVADADRFLQQQKLSALITNSFVDASERELGYRDALESMVLALNGAGLPSALIEELVQTALDAHGNNVGDDEDQACDDSAPSALQAG
jgi:hypothetical protein